MVYIVLKLSRTDITSYRMYVKYGFLDLLALSVHVLDSASDVCLARCGTDGLSDDSDKLFVPCN